MKYSQKIFDWDLYLYSEELTPLDLKDATMECDIDLEEANDYKTLIFLF